MKDEREAGFSYIEVMIAMVILLVGVLAVMAAISASVLMAQGQGTQLEAKQIASSTMESIMSVKETDAERLGWSAVGNIGSNPDPNDIPQGIFSVGRNSVRLGGGPDEVLGTVDDTGPVVPGFEREIVITDICDPERPSVNCPTPGAAPVRIRRVDVRIFYTVGQSQRSELISTVLTDYAVTD